MQAVVLAAGEGTRMRPLTAARPKPLLPVAGTPLIDHVLDACAPHVDGFVIVVGYEADAVRSHVGNEVAGAPVTYVTQDEQLGTGHAIGLAEPHIDGPFLALNGDIVVAPELVAALSDTAPPAVTVKPVADPSNYGVVSHDGTYITDIVEKPADPPSELANLGIYAFTPTVFEYIADLELSPRGEYEITDAVGALVDAHERNEGGGVRFVEYDGHWLDVGRPWELLEATELLLDTLDTRVDGRVAAGATIEGSVAVAEGARIRDGAYLEGPVVVQLGADVGPNCHVRGATVIGPDARVGNAVEIKNSILMADATVPHHAYVGDSVLGRGVNFGAGTKAANLRHDEATIEMTVKGERVDTGRRKLGVVAADGVKTGVNTSLNPGVKLGPGVTTRPGEAVMQDRHGD